MEITAQKRYTMKILIALIILGIIIAFHEFGHFIIAKSRGITVREFSIGMGPKLWSFEKGNTRYSLRLLPIGGSCAMGEDELAGDEDTNAFSNRSVLERIAVIFAGPFFNFILAFFFAAIIISIVGYDPAYVLSVNSQESAAKAGVQVNDRIVRFNGKRISLGRELATELMYQELDGEPIELVVERTEADGSIKEYKFQYTPEYTKDYMMGFYYSPNVPQSSAVITSVMEGYPMEKAGLKADDIIIEIDQTTISNSGELADYLAKNPPGENTIEIKYLRNGVEYTSVIQPMFVSEGYRLGFNYNYNAREKTDFFGVIKYSFCEVRYWIVSTVKSLAQMITGKLSTDDIGGPVRIVDEIGNVVEESKEDGALYVILNLMNWCILLSANLGVMNLLPIPALDGGRLLFLFIELIRGKPINKEKEGMVHVIGFILLIMLMVFFFFNDIKNIFF